MSGNTLLRQEEDNNQQNEGAQNPCYFGIYATIPSETESSSMMNDQTSDPLNAAVPKSCVKFHLISIQPIPAKIGYAEWTDSTSFLTFRSILLQQQPSSCILYTTHEVNPSEFRLDGAYTQDQLSPDLLNGVQNELTLANCPTVRQPLYQSSTNSSNLQQILSYHFQPKSLQAVVGSGNDDDGNNNNNNNTDMHDNDSTKTTKKVTAQARSIYPEEQILAAYNSCKNILLGHTDDEMALSAPIIMGLYTQMLKRFIITPLQELQQQEVQLAAGVGQANRSKLLKLTKTALQLPMKYLFSPIQLTTKLRIDQNTLNSIGVFPSPLESNRSSTSLFGLLNTCQTSFGSRLLQQWLKQPLLDIYELNQRHLTIGALLASNEVLTRLRGSLRGIADIEKILAKLNKYYNQTENCTNSDKVSSVMSSDIIKELLSLFGFVTKMHSIMTHLSVLGQQQPQQSPSEEYNDSTITTPHSTETGAYKDESMLYDEIASQYSEIDPETGEEHLKTHITSLLKPEQLLLHSVKMTPQQFLQIKYNRELAQVLNALSQFQALVENTIDLEAAAKHEFLIRADLTPELNEISKRKSKIFRALERLHLEACGNLDVDTTRVRMMYTAANDIGYHLRVTRRDEKLIRADTTLYQLLETRKDGVRFTTPNFQKLSSQYQEEVYKYHVAQATTCLQILDTAMTYCSDFHALKINVAELDVLSSFAHLVTSSPRTYVRPQLISTTGVSIGPNIVNIAGKGNNSVVNLDQECEDNRKFDFSKKPTPTPTTTTAHSNNNSSHNNNNKNTHTLNPGHITLNKARHPTIEAQPNLVFIPNDVHLKHGETELQLVTGPNMGGKSCYLRMTALIVLMAQVGCYVPCDSASICLVDCILARVGAGDMQLKGVSTFMKEMLETSEILHHGSANSLIVVDELGRGTSTYDGFGLAWGIAEYLATRVHSYTLFATHFHEMTAMSEQFQTVANKHVTALTGDDSITMLYKVQEGHCDRSFGIHVAQMANFPAQVINAARSKADALEAYAQQNLLQINLPLKHGEQIDNKHHKHVSLGMDDGEAGANHPTVNHITPVNTNSFSLATTSFDEKRSLDILQNAFRDNQFNLILDMPNIVNGADLDQIKMTGAIADVYNNVINEVIKSQ